MAMIYVCFLYAYIASYYQSVTLSFFLLPIVCVWLLVQKTGSLIGIHGMARPDNHPLYICMYLYLQLFIISVNYVIITLAEPIKLLF
jgi:hypothetical protein